ncbi:lipopolysaccharide assembly LapA domain-containing protein [Zoogloea sp.]|jgi:uncharacterized integral membrane protein|uniref:LapA family protein n=1 Tax=Zoogloea sp. TaxID=49181 RepID=UPI0035B299AE|nr:LapA family protein [Rhodocyclales bacterium]
MRALVWIFRLFLFCVLLGFAIKNDDAVTLHFFLGAQWQLPLVLVILMFVVLGVLIGVLATLSTVYRQHREIGLLRGRQTPPPPAAPAQPVVHGADLPDSY